MTRTNMRPARIGAVLILAAGLLVGTAPGVAGAALEVPAGPGRADPAAVAYLVRNRQLSPAEAARRITAQQGYAEIARRLTRQLGDRRMADGYIDDATGDLVVNVLDEEAAGVVRAAGARPRLVEHSTAELRAVLDRFGRLARAGAAPTVESFGIDARADAVVVRVAESAARGGRTVDGGAIAAAARRLGTAVRWETGTGTAVPTQRVDAGFTTFGPASCTAGFSATDSLQFRYLVTAAHCVNPDGLLYVNGQPFGTVHYYDESRDHAVVKNLNSFFQEQGPWVWDYGLGWKTVYRTFTPWQGWTVCKAGRTTGHTCGQVLDVQRSRKVNFNNADIWVNNLHETDMCVKGGDSGSPVYTASADPTLVYASGTVQSAVLYAQNGNLWPKSGPQYCGNETKPVAMPQRSYFQPVEATLAAAGVGIWGVG
ncbi:S1 family peptidase [Micromonospora sp. WMMC241]|uniref:S1 family peptidase n=1 Tax=Micromonospora sp. WMMC241 TaxID=3015159 RepID=UPI0022B6B598|nr:S1 family peptidase [Micromonospora sp. WMMC241]MCZ7439683.1 S1 family peptidase [Micromonospora sp. WMMC241]